MLFLLTATGISAGRRNDEEEEESWMTAGTSVTAAVWEPTGRQKGHGGYRLATTAAAALDLACKLCADQCWRIAVLLLNRPVGRWSSRHFLPAPVVFSERFGLVLQQCIFSYAFSCRKHNLLLNGKVFCLTPYGLLDNIVSCITTAMDLTFRAALIKFIVTRI